MKFGRDTAAMRWRCQGIMRSATGEDALAFRGLNRIAADSRNLHAIPDLKLTMVQQDEPGRSRADARWLETLQPIQNATGASVL